MTPTPFLAKSFPMLVAALLLVPDFILQAQQKPVTAHGVVFHVKSQGTPDQFATATAYAKAERFGSSVTAILLDGKSKLALVPPFFRAIYEFPNLETLTLTSAEDEARLRLKITEGTTIISRFPSSANLVKPALAAAETAIASYRAGQVAVEGRWMSAADYQKALTAPQANVIASFAVGSSVLKNVRLSSARDGMARVMHDGGFASLPVEKLTALQKAELARTNPSVSLDAPAATAMETGVAPASASASAPVAMSAPAASTTTAATSTTITTAPPPTSVRASSSSGPRAPTSKKSEEARAAGRARLAKVLEEMRHTTEKKIADQEAATLAANKESMDAARASAADKTANADALAAELKKKIDNPQAEKLANARRLNFYVAQKLKGERWKPLEAYAPEAYEIQLGGIGGRLAILACAFTSFESAGRGSIWAVEAGKERIEKKDTFDQTVSVFVEVDPKLEKQLNDIASQLGEITKLRDEASGELRIAVQEAEKRIRETAAMKQKSEAALKARITAFEQIERSLDWLYDARAPRLSQFLSNNGFTAAFRDRKADAVFNAFELKDFETLADSNFTGERLKLTESQVGMILDRLQSMEVNIVISSPSVAFKNGVRLRHDGKDMEIALVEVKRPSRDEDRDVNSRSSRTRLITSEMSDRHHPVEVHPDGNGLIFRAPLSGELFAFIDNANAFDDFWDRTTRSMDDDFRKTQQKERLGEMGATEVRQVQAGWRATLIRTLEKALEQY